MAPDPFLEVVFVAVVVIIMAIAVFVFRRRVVRALVLLLPRAWRTRGVSALLTIWVVVIAAAIVLYGVGVLGMTLLTTPVSVRS